MSTESDLIYDVGVHNGDDTGYYLHLGYRVVAVEANPMWAQRVGERFADAVSAGRLTVVNVAIGSQPGEADFHISTVNDAWGSFDTQIASRGGAFTTIRVPCVPFGGVLAEHGVPHYLKVDIEGNDRLCLHALGPGALPAFASVEMDHGDGDRDIATLATLGYDRFACIRQNDFVPVTADTVARLVARRRRQARTAIGTQLARVSRVARRRLRPPRDADWRFPRGSSGTFGDRLPDGCWMDVDDVLAVWRDLHEVDAELGAGGVGEWFDIHAALPGARPATSPPG